MGIVGVIGCIGSGKGAVSEYLVNEKGYARLSFADPVKDAGAAIFGWDRGMLQGDTEASRKWREEKDEFWSGVLGYKFTPRLALQLIGTEVGRNYFHPDIWLASLEMRYKTLSAQGVNVVVDDCRFPNEIEFISKLGGKLIVVERGHRDEWWQVAYDQNTGIAEDDAPKMEGKYKHIHPSEWSWISKRTFDISSPIANDGTLEHLKERVDHVLTLA